MTNESLEYRILRNQMVIMMTLRTMTANDTVAGLLDDNIKPTAEMLQNILENNREE